MKLPSSRTREALPRSFDDREVATAEPLPPPVAADLRQMMRLTAAGTAGRGLDAGARAKTGSAEAGGQEQPDSWFTAYRGDVAAAAVVPESSHGSEAAGPVVSAVLAAG